MGMYDTYEDDDEGMDTSNSSDNNAMRQVRRALAAAEKRIKELEAANTELSKTTRERSIKDVLSEKGLNPKIAAFVPSDLTDADSIQKWIDEYSDVFGGAAQGSDAPAVDQQTVDNIQSMDAAMAGGSAPKGQEALLERVKTMPYEELLTLIGGQGS